MLPVVPVPRLWPGATIVCLGSGPSLTPEDIHAIGCYRHARNLRVIAVNTTYQLAPWADVLYAPDEKWWAWHGANVSRVYQGSLKFTLSQEEYAERAGAQRLDWRSGGGLSLDPRRVMTGGHGGYQAINLSVHLGARRIILLGYDLQADTQHGHDHVHHPHPDRSVVPYEQWRSIYETLIPALDAIDVEIVNCSRATAITALPRASLEEVLERPWFP